MPSSLSRSRYRAGSRTPAFVCSSYYYCSVRDTGNRERIWYYNVTEHLFISKQICLDLAASKQLSEMQSFTTRVP
ncbi:hypothetical protein Mapa_018554 [Marchantia paleacea]|nr:hypothetical protein Mapa_018554 [Marchantia paleacea]